MFKMKKLYLFLFISLPLLASDYQSTELTANGRNFYTASVSGSAITYTAISISNGVERKKTYTGTISGDKVIFDKYGKNDAIPSPVSEKIVYSFKQELDKIYIENEEMILK
jgi:hypothetical protein